MTSVEAADPTSDGARHALEKVASGDSDATSVWWWVRNIVSWVLLLAVGAVLLAMVVVPRLSGATPYTVLTGSMEPGLPPGTLVVVKPTPAADLSAGDVITFQPYSGNPAVVTHRVEGIYYDAQSQMRIYTKGDANNVADDWVLVPEQVRGRVWYSVPQLGRVNSLLSGKSRSVLVTVVGVALAGYALWMFGGSFRDRNSRPAGSGDSSSGNGGPADGPADPGLTSTTETK
ncbi:signal peptidase I [Rhodococcus hoagii]|nr:signal peptidase I [Prescottella equi]